MTLRICRKGLKNGMWCRKDKGRVTHPGRNNREKRMGNSCLGSGSLGRNTSAAIDDHKLEVSRQCHGAAEEGRGVWRPLRHCCTLGEHATRF